MLQQGDKNGSSSTPSRKWIAYYALAIESAAPIVVGAAGGIWVDRHTSVAPWGLISLLTAGFGVSIWNLVRLSRKVRSR